MQHFIQTIELLDIVKQSSSSLYEDSAVAARLFYPCISIFEMSGR